MGDERKVRPKGADWKSMKLSPEEGFVLSRVDGPVSVRELVALTGLDEGRVGEIIGRLASEGALDVEGAPAPSAAPAAQPSRAPASQSQGHQALVNDPSLAEEPSPPEPEVEEPLPSDSAIPLPEESNPLPPDEDEDPAAAEERIRDENNYRKIYETEWHALDRDIRVGKAKEADGTDLCALCFDPEPQVIAAILTNPRCGFLQARLIAFYHRTNTGLDMLGRRNDFLTDQQVQRKLLANPQLPDAVLRKIVSPKLIMEVYKIAINREYPERTRVKVRELLQKKFMLGSADERAALMIKTEGRCLILLVNCALDVRTTQILCAKTTYTILFIQNLARWSATPPQLLTYLLKQPVVRQNMGLRKMILKHPNCPSEVKRNFSA